MSYLESVALPEHVQMIEESAFDASHLSEIFIPDSVTTISDTFFECPRSLILFYDNNLLVPQLAKENNLLYCKRSEYNPVLTVELVGGKPLNDDKNLGINQDDYNRVGRRSMNKIEFRIKSSENFKNSDYIEVLNGINNDCLGFYGGENLSQSEIQQHLTQLSTLLYQCGITEFNPKTIYTGKVGCFDKLVTVALNCRQQENFYEDYTIDGKSLIFADDQFLYAEVFYLFDFIPDASLVTGYSKQQHGIWYYPKELPKVTTEVLSFSGNLTDGNYVIKIKFTDNAGATGEKTFSHSLIQYDSVGGSNYRVILKGIQ